LFGIEVSDPGAVPGASTIICTVVVSSKLWERNRIDELNKGIIFTQYDSAGSFDLGSKKVNANDNNRFAAVAA
jgi:hypothetical protein